MNKRIQIQSEATIAIINNNYNGVIICSPRFGKCLTFINSIRDKSNWNICISSPYDSIKQSWSGEIVKWELGFTPTLICSASLKNINTRLDLLVIDEIQMLSDSQINWIIKKRPLRILGLTGTLDAETQIILYRKLGIKTIFEYSIEQAIEDNIIANFEIEVILCNFDDSRQDILSGTKNKPVNRSEQGHYNFLTSQFNKFKNLCYTDYGKYIMMKKYYMRLRKDFIYKSKSKLQVAKSIADRITRCIIFTGNIEEAELLSEYTYHNKNKKDNNLEKFKIGEINKLGVIQMSSMGVTFPDLKFAVIHQLQSNSELSIQKILRVCNLEDDRDAKIYITCYDNSVDKEWLESALSGIKQTRIKWTKLDEFTM